MSLQQKKVLTLVDQAFEDLELWYPIYRLQEEGAHVDIAGLEANKTYVGKYGVPATSDYAFTEVQAEDYDAILVPGGWAPDKLRRYPDVIQLIQKMDADRKTIGQICHAGWVLISADILKGKQVTSTPGIKDDMTNAGATWVDQPVIVDGHIVSSQRPPDLPSYGQALVDALTEQA